MAALNTREISMDPRTSAKTAAAAALLAACLGMEGAAAATMPATFNTLSDDVALASSAQISNVRYTLVDLTPNDGVSPSIQFVNMSRPLANSDFMVSASGSIYGPGREEGLLINSLPNVAYPSGTQQLDTGTAGTLSANLLSTRTLTTTSTDGVTSAYLDSQTLQASTRLTANDVATLRQAPYVSYQQGDWALEGTAISNSGVGGGYQYVQEDGTNHLITPLFSGDGVQADSGSYSPLGRTFILSPNTEVIFEGSYALESLTNLDTLSTVGLSADVGSTRALAGVGASLFRAVPKDGGTWWNTEAEMFDAYDFQSFFLSTDGTTSFTPPTSESTFKLGLKNTEAAPISATIDLATVAFYEAGGSVVPEPATWALMGLGLGGLAVAARKRRPA
jgi:hypothetical protein